MNTHLKTLIITNPNSWYSLFNLDLRSMRPPTSLKREFLRKWIMGLQICSSSKKEMSFLERKKAIKLSADVAMASARNAATQWSRALISKAAKDDSNGGLVECILGPQSESLKRASMSFNICSSKKNRSKKILRKSHSICRAKKSSSQKVMANSIAKRLVKKRTQVLKSLVPGGESMTEFCLLEETLDYILSLRAQIDVMRHLANATDLLNRKWDEDNELFLLSSFLYLFLQDEMSEKRSWYDIAKACIYEQYVRKS